MGAIRTVRSFAAEGRQEAAFGDRVDKTLRLGMRAASAAGPHNWPFGGVGGRPRLRQP